MTFSQFFRLLFQGLGSTELWCLLTLFAVQAGVPFVVQYALWRRLSDERKARAWNQLSWGSAVLLCPFPFATMLPFCWVTRRRAGAGPAALAILIGKLWVTVVAFGVAYASQLVLWLFGVQIAGM